MLFQFFLNNFFLSLLSSTRRNPTDVFYHFSGAENMYTKRDFSLCGTQTYTNEMNYGTLFCYSLANVVACAATHNVHSYDINERRIQVTEYPEAKFVKQCNQEINEMGK